MNENKSVIYTCGVLESEDLGVSDTNREVAYSPYGHTSSKHPDTTVR